MVVEVVSGHEDQRDRDTMVTEGNLRQKSQGRRALGFKGDFFFVYLLQLILKSDFAKRQFKTPDNI